MLAVTLGTLALEDAIAAYKSRRSPGFTMYAFNANSGRSTMLKLDLDLPDDPKRKYLACRRMVDRTVAPTHWGSSFVLRTIGKLHANSEEVFVVIAEESERYLAYATALFRDAEGRCVKVGDTIDFSHHDPEVLIEAFLFHSRSRVSALDALIKSIPTNN